MTYRIRYPVKLEPFDHGKSAARSPMDAPSEIVNPINEDAAMRIRQSGLDKSVLHPPSDDGQYPVPGQHVPSDRPTGSTWQVNRPWYLWVVAALALAVLSYGICIGG